mmetsp:Transcript_3633/g.6365  ORF Transcript_3633/g.6365 Transcript_3633/m.6365 type:complete len:224 (-) Transcript_3633:112-783(-)
MLVVVHLLDGEKLARLEAHPVHVEVVRGRRGQQLLEQEELARHPVRRDGPFLPHHHRRSQPVHRSVHPLHHQQSGAALRGRQLVGSVGRNIRECAGAGEGRLVCIHCCRRAAEVEGQRSREHVQKALDGRATGKVGWARGAAVGTDSRHELQETRSHRRRYVDDRVGVDPAWMRTGYAGLRRDQRVLPGDDAACKAGKCCYRFRLMAQMRRHRIQRQNGELDV